LRVFRAATPLIRFLNQPLLERLGHAPLALREPSGRDRPAAGRDRF
jgi:hypothetical protein